MKRSIQLGMVTAFVGAVLQTASPSGQTPAPAPPAPPAGSPGIYKTADDLAAVLRKTTEATPAMSTSAVANTDQYRINIVRRGKGAGAIAHAGNTEVHYIVDGSATFVTGGSIVRPAAAGAVAEIRDGVSRHVSKGDVVVIPENSPHWYKDVDGSITYLEVRFVAPPR
jgi:mannose-6-phosphate isomerase-like protein (cupin superfamily)